MKPGWSRSSRRWVISSGVDVHTYWQICCLMHAMLNSRKRGLEHIPWLYDSMMRLLPQINRWRHDLIQQAHGQTLEVGCGTGLGLAHYPATQSLVAIEPCLISLQRARRRTHAVDLINADAMQLPFVSDSFDTVVSSLVFCSVSDAGLGLQEIQPGAQARWSATHAGACASTKSGWPLAAGHHTTGMDVDQRRLSSQPGYRKPAAGMRV